MGKFIRRGLIVVLLILIGFGYFQWRVYAQKVQLREDALLYFQEEDYSKTIQYLEKSLEKKSFFAGELDQDMICYMAESYYQLGSYADAEAIYDELLENDKKNAEYYLLKGQCLQAEQNYAQAVGVFEKGWKQTGETDFLKRICEIYIAQEDYEQALAYAEQGIKEGGETKAALMYQKIIIYEKSKDYAAAYEAAEEYCALYPDDEKAEKEKIFLSTRI